MDEQVQKLEYTTKNKKALLLHDRLNNTAYSVVTRFTLHCNDMKGEKRQNIVEHDCDTDISIVQSSNEINTNDMNKV